MFPVSAMCCVEATIEKDGQQGSETDGISTATAGSDETEQQQISSNDAVV